ncbi:MAG: DNA gyrase inhibitor YacG [Planctomycetes bacterium]|nr:DNA gyrase inhibitor YacG [Planctomycetota bacterium]NUQ33436.1 DNA gyrase inhibitor YacG [Planctomycetaceae bacterium]
MAPALKKRRCPECKKAYTYEDVEKHPTYPFCSPRCRLIDLGAWLTEKYAVTQNIDPEIAAQLAEGSPESGSPPEE